MWDDKPPHDCKWHRSKTRGPDKESQWGPLSLFVWFGINQQEYCCRKKNSSNPSLMLIVIFRCEISQVTSVPKFWWPWVSVRRQLCVYRWGDSTRLHSFEMWQGERNDEIISDLWVTVAFREEDAQQGGLPPDHWQYAYSKKLKKTVK